MTRKTNAWCWKMHIATLCNSWNTKPSRIHQWRNTRRNASPSSERCSCLWPNATSYDNASRASTLPPAHRTLTTLPACPAKLSPLQSTTSRTWSCPAVPLRSPVIVNASHTRRGTKRMTARSFMGRRSIRWGAGPVFLGRKMSTIGATRRARSLRSYRCRRRATCEQSMAVILIFALLVFLFSRFYFNNVSRGFTYESMAYLWFDCGT